MDPRLIFRVLAVLLVALTANGARAGYALLESFTNQNGVGYYPYSSLVADGSVLYGTAEAGGADGYGTVFKSVGGGNAAPVHSFTGGTGGDTPLGGLAIGGSTLYGTTASGGAAGNGTVYKVGADGGGFSVLHDFTDAAAEGSMPLGGLVLGGSTLYGMTQSGGANSLGVVFRMGTDGAGFTTLYNFAGTDGASPQGSLILEGSHLFGMATSGGGGGGGVLFRVGTEGGFAILHEFVSTDSAGNGRGPRGSLIMSGDKFYGMTYSGGAGSNGVVFSIGTNGTGFTTLHEFVGGAGDGSHPNGNLLLFGDKLYSTTLNGGSADAGTLFEIGTNGAGFAVLHEFQLGVSDVWGPYSGVTQVGSTLYGVARRGGSMDTGGLYAYTLAPIPEPSVMISAALGALVFAGTRLRRRGSARVIGEA